MKNSGKLILAIVIILTFAFQSNAQSTKATNQSTQKQTEVNSTPGNYVDKDNNGVCDNLGTRSGKGRGPNFVDKDGDGICDHRASVGKNSGNKCRNGQGYQYRNGRGQGKGCGKYCRR